MIVGIDLGTTNSLVGMIKDGRPHLFKDANGSALIPSVVSLKDISHPVVGEEAKKNLDPAHTIYSAKRFMGRGLADVKEWAESLPFDFSESDSHSVRFKIGQKNYTPIEIAAFVLKKLKSLAPGADKAVITVPAYFNDAQRQATKLAGELAGLEVVRIVNEPTAACLAYGLDKKNLGHVAVFDLGGGTFDISILRVQNGIFEVLATNGDTALGGDDFDAAIAEGLKGPNLNSKKEQAEWIAACEKLKRELSEAESVTFKFKEFTRDVTRAELEAWVAPVLARVENPVKQCLTDSGLTLNQISDVILVGGSTRFPLVRKKVQEFFKREPICSLNPDEVVAMGAAVQANILAGHMPGMLLLDVIPLSLGIETIGGVFSKIIHRNSTIPISASETFSTYVDGQTSVDIHVLQGERELVSDNRSLSRFQLKGVPPMPAGLPKIEVEFIIDANGILSVKALELRTQTTASIMVNPSFGLTDEEVEKMLLSSYDNAEQDLEKRFLVEAQTEADGLLSTVKKSLEKSKDLVSAEELESIQQQMQKLQAAQKKENRTEIHDEIERLNEITKPLAEQILKKALNEAVGATP